jgi:hypothetical protein
MIRVNDGRAGAAREPPAEVDRFVQDGGLHRRLRGDNHLLSFGERGDTSRWNWRTDSARHAGQSVRSVRGRRTPPRPTSYPEGKFAEADAFWAR